MNTAARTEEPSNASPRRRFLLALLAALFVLAAAPSCLGWRLIAAYAAIPRFRATPVRRIGLETPNIPPPSAGWGIAVSPDGAVFVADVSGGRLLGFPNGTEESGRVLASGVGGRRVLGPCLALGPDGTLWLLEGTGGRVHVFTPAGNHLRSLELGSSGARCLAMDRQGGIAVSDPEARTIRKFLPDGDPDVSWGDPSTPGSVREPDVHGLAFSGETLYAATTREILLLDERGRISARRPTKAPVTELAVSPEGTLWASDIAANRVWIYSADGRLIGRVVGPGGEEDLFAQPRGLARPRRDALYVVNETWVEVDSIEEPRRPR